MFRLAKDYGDLMRESWRDVYSCIVQLYNCRLLPKSLLELEDYLATDGVCSIFPTPKITMNKSDSSLFSSFSFWLNSDGSTQKDALKPDYQARSRAENCIAQCGLEDLAADTCLLSEETLAEMCKIIISLCQGEAESSDRVAVLLMEILCDISLRNKDRIQIWWQHVSELLVSLINSASSPFLAERAVVNVVRISSRMLMRDGFTQQMLSVLKVLQNVNQSTQTRLVEQGCAGLVPLVSTNALVIHTSRGWPAIFALLQKATVSPAALNSALDIVSQICKEPSSSTLLTSESFLLCLDLLLHAVAVLNVPGHASEGETELAKPVKSGSWPNTEAAEALLKQMIELLSELHSAARRVLRTSGAQLWQDCWSKVLQAFGTACLDARKPVRQAGLALMNCIIFDHYHHVDRLDILPTIVAAS